MVVSRFPDIILKISKIHSITIAALNNAHVDVMSIISGAAQKAIAEGISVCSPKLHGLVVDWVRNNSKFPDFRDLHLILFDSHTPTMAMNFLKAKAPSIFILESSQSKAIAQKDFASDYSKLSSSDFLKKYDPDGLVKNLDCNPKQSRLEAFHANMRSLLIPSKVKPFNESFLKRLFNLQSEVFNERGMKAEQLSTVLVGCVPTSAAQINLLQSLLKQWILILHEMDEEAVNVAALDKPYNVESVYKFAKFSLITLLRTDVFAKLISAREDERSDLNFFTNQQLFLSFMFNILFDVKVLNNRDGFDFDHFQPDITAEKEAGFKRDAFYLVQLSPRDEEEVFDFFLQRGIDLPKDVIALSFWMELSSKLRKTKVCDDELSKFFGKEAYQPLFGSQRLVSSIEPQEFIDTFPKIREALVLNEALAKLYKIYRDQLLGYRREDYVD